MLMILLIIFLGVVVLGSDDNLLHDDHILHDDRLFNNDDDNIRFYSTGENFHYNDYYSHHYHHVGNYEYYYQYEAKSYVEYIGSIHTKSEYLYSVAISGTIIMAGGIFSPVYVFEYENNHGNFLYSWDVRPIEDTNYSVSFVATDGLRTVVQPYTGGCISPFAEVKCTDAAFIYILSEGAWSLEATLYNRAFAYPSLAVSGDTVVLGSSDSCNATIYRRSVAGEWVVEGFMHGTVHFADSVAISGDNCLIGSPSETPQYGAVYYYKRNSTNDWVLQDILTKENELFGSTVAMSGDYAVIGTAGPHETYLYHLEDGLWVFQTEINCGANALAISGNLILINDLKNMHTIRLYSLDVSSAPNGISGKDTTPSSSDRTVVAGAVGGGVAFLLIVILTIGYFRCRVKHSKNKYWWNRSRTVVPSETVGLDSAPVMIEKQEVISTLRVVAVQSKV